MKKNFRTLFVFVTAISLLLAGCGSNDATTVNEKKTFSESDKVVLDVFSGNWCYSSKVVGAINLDSFQFTIFDEPTFIKPSGGNARSIEFDGMLTVKSIYAGYDLNTESVTEILSQETNTYYFYIESDTEMIWCYPAVGGKYKNDNSTNLKDSKVVQYDYTILSNDSIQLLARFPSPLNRGLDRIIEEKEIAVISDTTDVE